MLLPQAEIWGGFSASQASSGPFLKAIQHNINFLLKARISGAMFQLHQCLALCFLFGGSSNKLTGFHRDAK